MGWTVDKSSLNGQVWVPEQRALHSHWTPRPQGLALDRWTGGSGISDLSDYHSVLSLFVPLGLNCLFYDRLSWEGRLILVQMIPCLCSVLLQYFRKFHLKTLADLWVNFATFWPDLWWAGWRWLEGVLRVYLVNASLIIDIFSSPSLYERLESS